MASDKPGSIKQAKMQEKNAAASSVEENLFSMENLDRSSPEMWPEKFPGLAKFINKSPQLKTTSPPYSKVLTTEESSYLQELASLSSSELVAKVKELHDVAYQLDVEEAKELARGRYLNILKKSKKHK